MFNSSTIPNSNNSITMPYYNNTTDVSSITIDGPCNISGNLTVNGEDITKRLDKIEERLAILVPDPEKLEKYQALQHAYEQYKLLEVMLND